jgi:hypothetical protein
MNWMFIFIIASSTTTDKVVTPITVPMATERLCEAAKTKMMALYQKTQSTNFLAVAECLQVR